MNEQYKNNNLAFDEDDHNYNNGEQPRKVSAKFGGQQQQAKDSFASRDSLNLADRDMRRSSVGWMSNMYWQDNQNNIENIKAQI